MTGKAGVPGRGRKPKPTSAKRLAGNPGKRALNQNEPHFTPLLGVACPEWLAEDQWAPTLWGMIIKELCAAEVLCITDLHNLEAFCTAYSRWRRAEIEITRHGLVVEGATGGPVKNPACTVANESLKQMTTYGALLGLDPSSRSRLIGGNQKKGESNPFNDF
ncbi:phage terminase small subunit P27 family [Aeromonas hydrophila]|uniref:phage terminase small subunit P27 family n=1 Tax=Aeromonas hydrophila TaxID=644 RepID=UPI0003A19858|nr:phage terminase small subunit P27 family [Aeromonas hydrophila]AHX31499.1 terminase [Aeromonas hydrophila subsp. hydrophila AL09-71]AHX68294.1 terminase [Aeromonas hydrophila pc104A]AJE37669.1 terminase [Aeromonas hydrophila J-1]AKJ35958.1 terminase [Aeromonas hydrophila NJ-35]ALQ64759.1 terminase [Aeromonas hydrophila]